MSTPLVAYYGDDFTGSTDVLEVLSLNGIETVLFLETPDASWMERFRHCRAFGLAGISRSQTPAWMDEHLPTVFEWLKSTGARLCHYKVCSTFDSSPEVGSIGRAIDIGQRVFGVPWVPLIAGAPALGRYTVFANLFAAVEDEAFRIDRHPTMSRHPVTPMKEGDLRLHLARQTAKRVASFNIVSLRAPDVDQRFDRMLEQSPEVVLFDILDTDSLRQAGRLMWTRGPEPQVFAAGSSGVEYALMEHLQGASVPSFANAGPVDRIVVLSGSCSPVTEQQIRWAESAGFAAIRLDARVLAGGDGRQAHMEDVAVKALAAVCSGRSTVLYTALGAEDRVEPDAPRRVEFNRQIGMQAGMILREVLQRSKVRRAIVAGGDTSSHAGRQLGLYALTALMPVAPGAPLCRAYSEDPARDGLEIVFKGGQCGGDDFFELVRAGKTAPSYSGAGFSPMSLSFGSR